MSNTKNLSEYLVLSRGQWDADKSPEEIQAAIDSFYEWHGSLVAQGRAKVGQRLARPSLMATKLGVIDGPFTESKEVIGGYWFFLATSLEEAAALASKNPCIACGLTLEVRPIEDERCSAFVETTETPRISKTHK